MTTDRIDASQRAAAKVVGAAYLLALVPAIFAEMFALGRLVVRGDAAQTAHNIVAHEHLFRWGIASNLSAFAVDVVLITALYIVLRPVHRGVALLAAAWGLVETSTLIVVTLNDFGVLRVLGNRAYLQAFDAAQLQALAQLSVGAHGDAYGVGLVLAGLRSTAFCWLWFKSGFVPKALAAWGVVASVLMGACALAFIVSPELQRSISVAIYGGPIFLFELTMGLWLVFRELTPAATR